ncbi:hypothetical protein RHMOL_Rhmol06G0312700 [Rhododendron molle]|uniref:Uncharacterized protein n=1 Tax=Rhododendron molle TaxID=49168 RepID=A0ACC0NJ12_RHOML|nr:hypothetical protein RHMOL_Rhmol06G0312700 [Rhododendron molle]
MSGSVNIELPMDKLCLGSLEPEESPETHTHLLVLEYKQPNLTLFLCLELARDALHSEGFFVIGGYMSPVNDAYRKRGLISAKHRIEMCHLACKSSEFIMVDPWEIHSRSCSFAALICWNLLAFLDFGFLSRQVLVRNICRDFGVVCIRREGQDIEKLISNDEILNEYKSNIKVVDELVPNQISSTRVRDCISRGLSIKYLTADEVIDYITKHHLYVNSTI